MAGQGDHLTCPWDTEGHGRKGGKGRGVSIGLGHTAEGPGHWGSRCLVAPLGGQTSLPVGLLAGLGTEVGLGRKGGAVRMVVVVGGGEGWR